MAADERRTGGERPPRGNPSGPRRTGGPRTPRDGERKPFVKRDGERKPYEKREGERKPFVKGDGERKPFVKRDGEGKPYEKRDGERRPFEKRDGERKPFVKREGERKPYEKRDGERKPWEKRDGERKPFVKRDGERKPVVKREGGADRGARTSRPPQSDDRRVAGPALPDEVTAHDLHASARNELKTLSKENADTVARHLAMAAALIDTQPELAHEHALAASRSAGRIAIVRESVAITAYATGDFALALRELRTYRRISGKDDQIALMVDSERGVGRPDRALEVGRAVDRAALPTATRVALAIAMSGARLDRGETQLALGELEIPELDPDRAFEWSPALFLARATVLEDLGRAEEAEFWYERADAASDALGQAAAEHDELIVEDGLVEGADDIDDIDEVEEIDQSAASVESTEENA